MDMNSFIQSLLSMILNFKRKNPRLTLFGIVMILFWSFKKLKEMTKRPKSLKNQVVLVTGGVSGIGRLTALLLKLKGAIVIVWDVNDNGIREMEELVDSSMKVDITSSVQIDSAAKDIFDKFGHVDILINNAGIVNGKPLLELNKRQIQKCFEVNVISHFWTIQAFLPKMIERKCGHIVTISSCAAVVGTPRLVDYAASKAACRSLHDTLNLELLEQGIRDGIHLSCITPYFISTGMFDGTVTTKYWILRKLGFDFLEPEYVASEIIRAIQYDINEIFLPGFIKLGWMVKEMILSERFTSNILIKSGVLIKSH